MRARDQLVQLVHVSAMVFPIVELQRLRRHVRLQGIHCVRQGRQLVPAASRRSALDLPGLSACLLLASALGALCLCFTCH